MKTIAMVLVSVSLLFVGCDKSAGPDYTPPSPPTGLVTQTGDNFIELFWDENFESDLAGYNIFVSSSYDGRYELIGSTRGAYFLDDGARNGFTYYYGVTAFDFEGNESDLSRDVAYDVPRPEGYNVVLNDYRQQPWSAGYDFSDYSVVPYSNTLADMYFENFSGDLYMNVRDDTDIQDMGPTNSLLEITIAPDSSWSATHDVRLYAGHTYVVWTWDDHYAKFRVTNISPGRVVFDWAYQLQQSNPMLKRATSGGKTREAVHKDKVR